MKYENNTESASTGAALDDLRVLDLSRVLAGPWASQILGDLGAEVIKVEQPGKGDDTRGWGPPFLEDGEDGDIFAAYYLACNRNKRSIAIDIAKPEGAELVKRLAQNADIVIENFKVGGLARYGLDYSSLREVKPDLIYCSITGFGQSGPYAPRGGYDFLIQAMGGIMSVTGLPPGMSGAEPTKVGLPVADLFTGLYAVIAIQAALRHRDRTGEGQHIDCALLDTTVAILGNQAMNYLVGGKVPHPMGNAHPNVVPYRPFAVADGQVIVAVGSDRQYQALCRMLGREDLAEDPRFVKNAGRLTNREILEPILEDELAGRSRQEVLDGMVDYGVPGGPINSIDQVFADPHIIERDMLQRYCTERGTELALTRFPAILSRTPASIRRLPPRLGQDSEAVLREVAGLSEEEISDLAQHDIVTGDICENSATG